MQVGESYKVVPSSSSETVDYSTRQLAPYDPSIEGQREVSDDEGDKGGLPVAALPDKISGSSQRIRLSVIGEAVVQVEPECDQASTFEAVRVVREFMSHHELEIRFDGTLSKVSGPYVAKSRADIAKCLLEVNVHFQWMIDTIMLELREQGSKIAEKEIIRAVRHITGEDTPKRLNTVLEPLYDTLSPTDSVAAQAAWGHLAQTAFETPAQLVVACLAHFIWQVKRRFVNERVEHHLMPVIFSATQSSGKSTFVRNFLGPLRELSAEVPFSDIADRRSGDIYRFPALNIDEMEEIKPATIPLLKSRITSDQFHRRDLGTSNSSRVRQRATLIGTTNTPIYQLVPDRSGNRRFASLEFRNGNVDKGGHSGVWSAVKDVDYELLWRSVDVFADSPIKPHLAALAKLQNQDEGLSPLYSWLKHIDFESEDIKRITTQSGLPAKLLFEYFLKQTGLTMSMTQFGNEMSILVTNPSFPLSGKTKTAKGTFYIIKNLAGEHTQQK